MKLLNILPFLDNDDLKGLVEKIKNNEVKGVRYTHLYPFLNDRDIDELVDLLVKDGNAKDLYSALPFMSDKRLEQLHKEVKAGKVEGFKESALLPFLGKDAIKAMVEDLIKNSVDEVDDLADEIEKAVDDAFDE